MKSEKEIREMIIKCSKEINQFRNGTLGKMDLILALW
jgi:hypothetical protein